MSIAYHDPALGERSEQKGDIDYAAIAVVACNLNECFYFLDCYLQRSSPSQQIEAAFALHKKWRFDKLYLESNHFQLLMRQPYQDAQARQPQSAQPLQVIPLNQHRNKEQRIRTLEPDITNGHLLFCNTLDPRVIQQLALFPTTHDDAPDALQGAVDILKRLQRAATLNDLCAAPVSSSGTLDEYLSRNHCWSQSNDLSI